MQTLTFQSTLAHARALAQLIGPLAQAEDMTEAGLAAAQANWELLRGPGWCTCGGAEQVYFRRELDGWHGFMCCHCWRLTQAG